MMTRTKNGETTEDNQIFSNQGGMNAGILTNPKSGGNRKTGDGIRDFLNRNSGFVYAEATNPEEIRRVLADFAARDVNLLVINGGDGTIQSALTAIYGSNAFRVPPLIALLKAGTTSMLALDAGVKGAPLPALEKILRWNTGDKGLKHEVLKRHIIKVNDESGREPLCGMFFGAGAIPFGIELFNTRINRGGMRGEIIPAMVIARFLLQILAGKENSIPETPIEISIDRNATVRCHSLCTMITTLERLFLGIHPFWGREGAPLHFTMLEKSPKHLLANLPFLLWGKKRSKVTRDNGYFSHNACIIKLDFTGRFILDGEFFEATTPLTIEPAGPAKFLRL